MTKIPCFLIARDRFTCLKNMVEYLVQIPELEVIILDNASTYEPLLNWYNTNPCTIERLPVNYGNFVLWSSNTAIPGHEKPNFREKYNCENSQYILSDCDLDLSGVPMTGLLTTLQEGLRRYPWAVKCGLSLEINDLPDNEITREVKGVWEGNNWHLIDDVYIKAPIDTTFALYTGVGEQNDFDNCLRVNRPYVCRHLSWYITEENITEEDRYYFSGITSSFNHYSIRYKNKF
jgi:hypothetical protein